MHAYVCWRALTTLTCLFSLAVLLNLVDGVVVSTIPPTSLWLIFNSSQVLQFCLHVVFPTRRPCWHWAAAMQRISYCTLLLFSVSIVLLFVHNEGWCSLASVNPGWASHPALELGVLPNCSANTRPVWCTLMLHRACWWCWCVNARGPTLPNTTSWSESCSCAGPSCL